MIPLFKNIKLFKDQNIQEAEMPEIVACLSYEVIHPPDYVFEFGKFQI